jgi:H+-transporting ATPase
MGDLAGVVVINATDVAKAAAALVLTLPDLGCVVPAIEVSRSVFERITTYTLTMLVKKIEILDRWPSAGPCTMLPSKTGN